MYIAICDDDINIAENLRDKLFKAVGRQIVKTDIFNDPDSLLSVTETRQFDIIFMDIKLGDVSGIKLSQKILAHYPDTQIVFISGYDDFYLDVYDVDHAYFLKKPFDDEKLIAAFAASRQRLKNRKNNFLALSGKNGLLRVDFKDILCLEKNQRLILIHTNDNNTYKMYGKFSDLEGQLTPLFIQCHASYMVNFRHVTALERQEFCLSDGRTIPISKSYYKDVKEAFLAYLERKL